MRRPIGRRRVDNTASLWELLGLGSPDETAWMVDALCAQTDPDAFFAECGGDAAQRVQVAKAICARCPVLAECRQYAIEHDERDGVWGGTSPRERRAMRLRRAGGRHDQRSPHRSGTSRGFPKRKEDRHGHTNPAADRSGAAPDAFHGGSVGGQGWPLRIVGRK